MSQCRAINFSSSSFFTLFSNELFSRKSKRISTSKRPSADNLVQQLVLVCTGVSVKICQSLLIYPHKTYSYVFSVYTETILWIIFRDIDTGTIVTSLNKQLLCNMKKIVLPKDNFSLYIICHIHLWYIFLYIYMSRAIEIISRLIDIEHIDTQYVYIILFNIIP